MIVIKTPAEIEAMRASGRIAAQVRDEVAARVAPGVSTRELAEFAGERIGQLGAQSAFLGYRGYPAPVCISVNDVVVHGIPDECRVCIGDIVSLDVGIRYGGFIGDTALTVMVGVTDPEVIRLVRTTERCLYEGLRYARAGGRLSDISHAIEATAREAGFAVVRQFVGHGIGRQMHEDPQVPNFGAPGKGPRLRTGMTLAIEPMLNAGQADVSVGADGWTVRTKDGSRSAHFEHTVAIGPDGADILTLRN